MKETPRQIAERMRHLVLTDSPGIAAVALELMRAVLAATKGSVTLNAKDRRELLTLLRAHDWQSWDYVKGAFDEANRRRR